MERLLDFTVLFDISTMTEISYYGNSHKINNNYQHLMNLDLQLTNNVQHHV